jgi:hypothetical protein
MLFISAIRFSPVIYSRNGLVQRTLNNSLNAIYLSFGKFGGYLQ